MVVQQWLTVLAVTGAALAGVLLGLASARLKGNRGLTGFFAAMGIVLLVVLGRRFPAVLPYAPVTWIMQGRVEYVAMGLAATMGMSTLLPRIPRPRMRWLVGIFMVVAALRHAVLPFAYPLFIRDQWKDSETMYAKGAYCRQSTHYSCGPAAAVSALAHLDVPASEGELVIQAYTSPVAGTDGDLLADAINRRYSDIGIAAKATFFRSINDLKNAGVAVVQIKYSFWVDHFVAVLEVTDEEVVYVDPINGQKHRDTHESFEQRWRKCGVTISRMESAAPTISKTGKISWTIGERPFQPIGRKK